MIPHIIHVTTILIALISLGISIFLHIKSSKRFSNIEESLTATIIEENPGMVDTIIKTQEKLRGNGFSAELALRESKALHGFPKSK